MGNLVERLREDYRHRSMSENVHKDLKAQAADEIERLRESNEFYELAIADKDDRITRLEAVLEVAEKITFAWFDETDAELDGLAYDLNEAIKAARDGEGEK